MDVDKVIGEIHSVVKFFGRDVEPTDTFTRMIFRSGPPLHYLYPLANLLDAGHRLTPHQSSESLQYLLLLAGHGKEYAHWYALMLRNKNRGSDDFHYGLRTTFRYLGTAKKSLRLARRIVAENTDLHYAEAHIAMHEESLCRWQQYTELAMRYPHTFERMWETQQQLNSAIETQRFEDAAVLRDELADLVVLEGSRI